MPGQSALDIAISYLDAFTRADFEDVAPYIADDFRFDGPQAHYASAAEFLAGAKAFAEQIEPGWTKVAAFGDDKQALLLYDLHLRSGATMRLADHYTVADGKILTEQILWDTGQPLQ